MHPTIVHHHDGDGDDWPHRRRVRRNKRKLSSTVLSGSGVGGADETEVTASTPKRAKRSHHDEGVKGHSSSASCGHDDAHPHRRSGPGATKEAPGRPEGMDSRSATDPSLVATSSSYASSSAGDTTTLFRQRRRPPQSSCDSALASARIARVLVGPQYPGSRHRDGDEAEMKRNGCHNDDDDGSMMKITASTSTTGRKKALASAVSYASSIVSVNASVANGHIGRGGNGATSHPLSSANGDVVVTPPSEPTPPRIGRRSESGNKGAPMQPPENVDAPSGATTNDSPSTALAVRGQSVVNVGKHRHASDSSATMVTATNRGRGMDGKEPQRRRGLCSTILLVFGLLILSIAVPLATLAVLAGRDVVRSRGREAEQLRFELLEALQELDGATSARRDDAIQIAEARRRLEEALGSKDEVGRALGEAWGRVDDLIASNEGLTKELGEAREAVGALAAERDALESAREELSMAVSRTFQLELDAVAHEQLVLEWTAMKVRMEDEIMSLRERLARQEEEAVLAIDAVIRAAHDRGGEEISAFEGRCAEEVYRQGRIAADAINAVAMAATASSSYGGGSGDVGGATTNGERGFEEDEAVVTEVHVSMKE